MTEYEVTCRQCGAVGLEDATDPCPGLCPACFQRLLARMTDRLQAFMEGHPKASAADGWAFLADQLRRHGLTPAAVARATSGASS